MLFGVETPAIPNIVANETGPDVGPYIEVPIELHAPCGALIKPNAPVPQIAIIIYKI
jgi:hypothetical protein